MSRADDLFDDWKRRADQCDLLATAVIYGAKLKRAGREHVGPCMACGGNDRFSINPSKNLWHCRGHGGGHGAVGMVMHAAGLSFIAACEALTGEPNPSGRASKPISEAEKAERNRQRLKMEDAARARQAQEAQYQEETTAAALRIWDEAVPLRDDLTATAGDSYLTSRGLAISFDPQWPDCLRFARLPYPKKPGLHPALVCRVDDMSGDLCAVWRIFLRSDARKLDVAAPKLGLGPAGGGAVRIGGTGPKIGLAEGLESALGAWNLIGRKYPVWAALSTSGLVGIELPLGIEHVVLFPDGDRPVRKKGNEYEPAVPAGRKAALTLRTRLLHEGIACTIAAEPAPGKDYADTWNEYSREVA